MRSLGVNPCPSRPVIIQERPSSTRNAGEMSCRTFAGAWIWEWPFLGSSMCMPTRFTPGDSACGASDQRRFAQGVWPREGPGFLMDQVTNRYPLESCDLAIRPLIVERLSRNPWHNSSSSYADRCGHLILYLAVHFIQVFMYRSSTVHAR